MGVREMKADTPLASSGVARSVQKVCPDTVVGCPRHPASAGYRSPLSISQRSMNSYAMARIS